MSVSSSPIQLVAGLANPGKGYAKSRHNAGAWFLHAFAENTSLSFKTEARFHGALAQLILAEHALAQQKCWFLIPNTYMNHSGLALRAVAHFYHIPTHAILIVHDDLDLPPGTMRFKFSGGTGGHNGLKDIVTQLGSKDFWRLRIGIGHPGQREQVHDYVLSPPALADRQKIDEVIAFALTLLIPFVQGEQQKAVHQLHNFTEK
jgi:peptidyl-tRNA hydrolase, PTH1 family